MRITAIVVAGLVASTLVTASPAQAEVTAQPALSRFYPLQPSPSLRSDPRSEAEERRRQISDLDASWDSLTPEQRNQRIAQLQQQVSWQRRRGPATWNGRRYARAAECGTTTASWVRSQRRWRRPPADELARMRTKRARPRSALYGAVGPLTLS